MNRDLRKRDSSAPLGSHSDIVPDIAHDQPIEALAVLESKLDKSLIILSNSSQVLPRKVETVGHDLQACQNFISVDVHQWLLEKSAQVASPVEPLHFRQFNLGGQPDILVPDG